MLRSDSPPGQGGPQGRPFTLRSPVLSTCCSCEDGEVGEGHLQLCSLLALFLRILTILAHPFKILCRAEGRESTLSCVKTNVSILPFKTVMALSNWIATVPRVIVAKVKDSDKNMLWSKMGIAA